MLTLVLFQIFLGFQLGVFGQVILEYQLGIDDLNVIFLECFDDGETEPNPDSVFVFFDPITGNPLQTRLIPRNENRLRFKLTPENEATIRCYTQNRDVTSVPVSIASECT